MDFDNYSHWNPFIKSISGEKSVGGKLVVKIQPPNAKEMTFKPKILKLEENKVFKWLGHAPIKGLFDGAHSFILEELESGSTKFKHEEVFTGILIGLSGKVLDKTEEGFRQMNEALKKECETIPE